MEKMFVHIALKSSFTAELQEKYANSIVFIKDSGEIFTHGIFYSISKEWQSRITTAESDIDALQTAVQALQTTYAFTAISDGKSTASATATAKTIKFNATGKATVSVDSNGVTIGAAGTTLAEGVANGQTSVDGTSKSIVKGLNTAAFHPEDYFYTAAAGQATANAATKAQSTADAKVASVTAAAKSGITVTGTATAPVVGLQLDTTGNVTLSQSDKGLKASVIIPSATVTGVTTGDKVLSLNDTTLSTTLSLDYDSKNKKIRLLGIDNEEIAAVDATDFIKDGMVKNVEFNPTSKNLTITFNTDSGQEAIVVDMTSLVDTYTAGSGISITEGKVINAKIDAATENFLSVSDNGIKLGGVQTAINTAKSAVIGSTSDNASAITIYGAKAYANSLATNYATAAQGTKADNALQSIVKGQDGDYVTTTIGSKSGNSQTVATAVTIQKVSTASITTKGLAEASDVKSYVDNLFAWEEL